MAIPVADHEVEQPGGQKSFLVDHLAAVRLEATEQLLTGDDLERAGRRLHGRVLASEPLLQNPRLPDELVTPRPEP